MLIYYLNKYGLSVRWLSYNYIILVISLYNIILVISLYNIILVICFPREQQDYSLYVIIITTVYITFCHALYKALLYRQNDTLLTIEIINYKGTQPYADIYIYICVCVCVYEWYQNATVLIIDVKRWYLFFASIFSTLY